MTRLYQVFILLFLLLIFAALTPWQWYPRDWRVWYADNFGASAFQEQAATIPAISSDNTEEACPPDIKGWRKAQTIAGIDVSASSNCLADNPHAVAAFVKGTNNVGHMTLMKSRLSPDAVVKGRDLDGDGDPDEIHIRLEVFELNGGSPDLNVPVTQYAIAPGVMPGLWVFAPKSAGMSTENFESLVAQPGLRLPSPAIRVEQGDKVIVTLENTHYMPHTIHFHGVDHPFQTASGEGNDGVPVMSEMPVMPGQQRSYEMQPRQAGTMFYHCHVEVQAHVLMGLNGMFVIEENRPNNWVQTFNIGDGFVRHSSVAVKEEYDREYDLHYQDLDKELGAKIQQTNDPRLVTQQIHREYDISQADFEYYTLNGRSFPYTAKDSLIVTAPNEKLKLRVLNGGSEGVAIHTHGHKVTISHYDGVEHPEPARITRDVVWVASAQRVDLELSTVDDGLHSYGEGVWLMHDHQERGVTTDGFGPGGNVSAIVYERFLQDDGWPMTFGMAWKNFLTPGFYQRQEDGSGVTALLPGVEASGPSSWRLFAMAILAGLFVGILISWILKGRSNV
ncbi:copper oxidase [Gammaproteobacteria bacterium 53_120_T64]|nr:copper oxidase [Gammaproteobacteria bacterium 53_120_T64]